MMTYTGVLVDPFSINIDDIRIEDIAHSLSMKCRFNGHVSRFYSVAEHCVYVSLLARDPKVGLLHDASECFLSDIITPIKIKFPDYKELESSVDDVIFKKFYVEYYEKSSYKEADTFLFFLEAQALTRHRYKNLPKQPSRIRSFCLRNKLVKPKNKTEFIQACLRNPLSPKKAKKLFLLHFNNLFS